MRAEIGLIDSRWAMEPTYVVGTTGRRTIVGRDLELHLEPNAVTAGDVWVYDPQSRVLLAGDLVTLPAPFLDTACPKRWRSALVHLETTRFITLVPGHGAPMDHDGLKTYRKAFNKLLVPFVVCALRATALNKQNVCHRRGIACQLRVNVQGSYALLRNHAD